MQIPSAGRFPKDFASTLMTVACVEALLLSDRTATPYAWEKKTYGAIDRFYGSGPKTRGSMARNRSGQVVVLPKRLTEWATGRPGVAEVAGSPLWLMLREQQQWSDAQWLALEPASRLVLHEYLSLVNEYRRRPMDSTLPRRLAACGTFDGIAALWKLLLDAQSDGRRELAFDCARHLVAAVTLLGATPVGNRVAFPILARIRQLGLDQVRWEGRVLSLSDYDLPARSVTATDLPALRMTRSWWLKPTIEVPWPVDQRRYIGRDIVIPDHRMAWIRTNLPPTKPASRVPSRLKWRGQLGPLRHPASPCHQQAIPAFHALALERIRGTLRWFS